MRVDLLLIVAAFVCATQARSLKRCANLFDDGCYNEGLLGSSDDENWLGGGGTPGKRNLALQANVEEGLLGSSDDEQWLAGDATPGKKKRCANVFDEGCANGGVVGSADDEEFLNEGLTPGKRSLPALGNRCANLFDDGCSNGGLLGSVGDENWLGGGGTPGKRSVFKIGTKGQQRTAYGPETRNNMIRYLLRGMYY